MNKNNLVGDVLIILKNVQSGWLVKATQQGEIAYSRTFKNETTAEQVYTELVKYAYDYSYGYQCGQ